MSFFLLNPYTLVIWCVVCFITDTLLLSLLMSIVHMAMVMSWLPPSTICGFVVSLSRMWDFVSVTLYLLSQNCPRDSKALLCICGKMYAFVTSGGKYGSLRLHVCDACIVLPSGCWTRMPRVYIYLFVYGAVAQT